MMNLTQAPQLPAVTRRRAVWAILAGAGNPASVCFAAPRYAGGLEEVMESAEAISVLDLDALGAYLHLLDQRRQFAILGFFLERQAQRLFVPPPFLERLERARPASKVYLDKHQRGGRLIRRWNLIVPGRWATSVESGERV